jgi:NADH dehydrogenase [ubiquinone] 1 alpha subcomplex assembly factor 6
MIDTRVCLPFLAVVWNWAEQQAKNLTNPPSARTLEDHLQTHGPLSSALLLGPLPLLLPPTHAQTSHVSHTLSHLATLLTATSLLRTLPILVGKRQVNIPADIAAKHNIVEEDVLRNGSNANGLRDGLWDIGTRGMDELITARRELKATGGKVDPGNVMPLFLSVVSFSSSYILLSFPSPLSLSLSRDILRW